MSSVVIFNLSLILLLAKVNLIAKEQDYKKNVFKARNTSRIKIIFVLMAEEIALHM